MCATHLFRATHSANHPLHHSVPREKLLRNNLCYSREPGLCFCATWRKHKTFCPSRNSAGTNRSGGDVKPRRFRPITAKPSPCLFFLALTNKVNTKPWAGKEEGEKAERTAQEEGLSHRLCCVAVKVPWVCVRDLERSQYRRSSF